MMTEKCMYCDRDALLKPDYDTYCAECYMRRELENARPHTPRSRTFTTSPMASAARVERICAQPTLRRQANLNQCDGGYGNYFP
jgi:hypothetical protein